MEHTFVDEKSLKSLEDYAVIACSAVLTLTTLQNFQVRAIEIGIMPEDMNERANTMIWDLRRLIKQYQDQANSALEIIGDGFDHGAVIDRLKKKELVRARAMTRTPKGGK